jgi:hypothetical protein
MTEPTDRSIPAVMITNVAPIAAIAAIAATATIADWVRTFSRLLLLRNPSVTSARTTINARRTGSMASSRVQLGWPWTSRCHADEHRAESVGRQSRRGR